MDGISLKDYEPLVRELIKKEDERDENWKWSLKYLGKRTMRIRWGYLDYLHEKDNSFIITLDRICSNECLFAMTPHKKVIECFFIVDGKSNPEFGAEQTIESGLRDAVFEISHYAHSRY